MKIDSGMRRLCFRNLLAGKNLPRATPAMSGTIASTSSILCSISHFSVSLDITHGGFEYTCAVYRGTALTPTGRMPTLRDCQSAQTSDVSEFLLRGDRSHAAATAAVG